MEPNITVSFRMAACTMVLLLSSARGLLGSPKPCTRLRPTFQQRERISTISQSVLYFSDENKNNEDKEKEKDQNNNFPSSLDDFLDKPFFDPDMYDDNDKSILGRLAQFVKSDYELAETFYVGTLFVILVIVSQELLRMQLHGDAYVAFQSATGSSGRLF